MFAGRRALAECAGFDRLAGQLRLPLTARRQHLGAYAEAYPDWDPWLFAITGPDGAWVAAALLARRRRGGLTQVTRLGQDGCDHGRLPAADSAAAAALAAAIAGGLAGIRGPWTLRLEQLPAADPVAGRLAGLLGAAGRLGPARRAGQPGSAGSGGRPGVARSAGSTGQPGSPGSGGRAGVAGSARSPGLPRRAELVAGVGLPRIQLSADRSPNAYLDKKFRQQVNAARRRFVAAGVQPRVVYLRSRAEVEPLLSGLLAIRRERDRAALYRRELDDRRRAGWWRAALLGFAERGELELAVLDVGTGVPAAYNAALLDGSSYRCWDGRINAAWHQQWPGQLLLGEVLARVMADRRWAEVDYQRGETPFKLRTANDVVATEDLVAASSPTVRLAAEAPGSARRWLRRWKAANPAVEAAWRTVKARRRDPLRPPPDDRAPGGRDTATLGRDGARAPSPPAG